MGDNYFAYRERTVGYNVKEGKWVFGGRMFRRHGQADKAAREAWRKLK